MVVYENCIEKAGLDLKKVKSLARRFEKLISDAKENGISLFAGSVTSLRFDDNLTFAGNQALILAHIDGIADGGDGGCIEDDEGFLRGE